MKDIHKTLIKLKSLLMLIGIQNIHKNDAIYIYWIAAEIITFLLYRM